MRLPVAEFGRDPSTAATVVIPDDDRCSFGCLAPPSRLALTPTGLNTLEHVLICLRYEHSEALYCPLLPIVVAACLHWMSPEQTFSTAMALLQEPSPLLKTRLDTWLLLAAFARLAATHTSGAYNLLLSTLRRTPDTGEVDLAQDHPLRGVALDWVSNALPFWALMRFLDNFVVEGDKTLYRVGLAVVQAWGAAHEVAPRRTLRRRPKPTMAVIDWRSVLEEGGSEGMDPGLKPRLLAYQEGGHASSVASDVYLPSMLACLIEDADAFIHLAFSFRLTRELLCNTMHALTTRVVDSFRRSQVARSQRRAHAEANQAMHTEGR